MRDYWRYFIAAVVFLGSCGIWLPPIIAGYSDVDFGLKDFTPNIITYFCSILFAGGIDNGLKISKAINEREFDSIMPTLWNTLYILIGTIIFAWIVIHLHVNKHDIWSFILGIVGMIISWLIWWFVNRNNPNISTTRPNTNPMGGTVE